MAGMLTDEAKRRLEIMQAQYERDELELLKQEMYRQANKLIPTPTKGSLPSHTHTYVVQREYTPASLHEMYFATCSCGHRHRVYPEHEVMDMQKALERQDKMIQRLNEEVYRLTAIVNELEGLENA